MLMMMMTMLIMMMMIMMTMMMTMMMMLMMTMMTMMTERDDARDGDEPLRYRGRHVRHLVDRRWLGPHLDAHHVGQGPLMADGVMMTATMTRVTPHLDARRGGQAH